MRYDFDDGEVMTMMKEGIEKFKGRTFACMTERARQLDRNDISLLQLCCCDCNASCTYRPQLVDGPKLWDDAH